MLEFGGPITAMRSDRENHLALSRGPTFVDGAVNGKGRRLLPPALVGTAGFEPATSSSRTMRATKLRYVPRGVDCSANSGDLLSQSLHTDAVDAVSVHPHHDEPVVVDGELVPIAGDVPGGGHV